MDRLAPAADRVVQVAAFAFAILYLLSGILYLCFSYWNVTQQDFWLIYDISLNYPWLQSALFKIHNHSLFFPSFIWFSDLRFFHGYQVVLFIVGLVLLIASTGLLLVPIWRERTVDLTGKSLATLAMILGSFWMGRAAITVAGGFNCMTSLVMLGAAVAFLCLPQMRALSPTVWRATALVVFGGLLGTFSFGTGFAIWPSLLLLGWCLRLPWRSLGIIVFAALLAFIVYRLLPPPQDDVLAAMKDPNSPQLVSLTTVKHLCRLAGAPLFYSVTAWQNVEPSRATFQSAAWLLWGGAVGWAVAIAALMACLLRRNLKDAGLEFIGAALISFTACVFVLIVVGRLEHFQKLPFEIAAPRYLFWSSLFWTGILLVTLKYSQDKRWLRWPGSCLALIFAIGGWQEHRDEGLHWRYARLLADESATSLINGVADPARLLAPSQELIDTLAPKLRAYRLDMFADGLQDWIGQPAARPVEGRENSTPFRGRAVLKPLVGGRDQHHAVKVSGQIFAKGSRPPPTMVIIAPDGKVAGIARSFHTDPFLNRLLYGGRMPNDRIAGYIRDYDPASRYILRAAGEQGLSREKIAISSLDQEAK